MRDDTSDIVEEETFKFFLMFEYVLPFFNQYAIARRFASASDSVSVRKSLMKERASSMFLKSDSAWAKVLISCLFREGLILSFETFILESCLF